MPTASTSRKGTFPGMAKSQAAPWTTMLSCPLTTNSQLSAFPVPGVSYVSCPLTLWTIECQIQLIIPMLVVKKLSSRRCWSPAVNHDSTASEVKSHLTWAKCKIYLKNKSKMRWERWAEGRLWETWVAWSGVWVDWLPGIIPMSLVPDHTAPEPSGHRKTILTVMDLIAVLLQALNLPFLQHAVSHQQLEEPPVDIGHGARSSWATLHGDGAKKEVNEINLSLNTPKAMF